jgi:hypothetical protein
MSQPVALSNQIFSSIEKGLGAVPQPASDAAAAAISAASEMRPMRLSPTAEALR